MSYCRWSSDKFMCDVYVYHSVGDYWSTNVAASRPEEPMPDADMRLLMDGQKFWWLLQHRLAEEARETIARKPIGLPHDGESFEDATPGDCADRLEYLRSLGYLVPQHAIDALRAEAGE